MTTIPVTLGRESLLGILGRKLAHSRVITKVALQLLLRLALMVAGFSLLTAAAWAVALPLGLLVAGLSCLVLEWAVKR